MCHVQLYVIFVTDLWDRHPGHIYSANEKNEGSELLCNLPKVTRRVSGKDWFSAQLVLISEPGSEFASVVSLVCIVFS